MIYYIDHSNKYNDILGGNGFGFNRIKVDDPDELSIRDRSLLVLHTLVELEDWLAFAESNKEVFLLFIGSKGDVPCDSKLIMHEKISSIKVPIKSLDTSEEFKKIIKCWSKTGTDGGKQKTSIFSAVKLHQVQDNSSSIIYALCIAYLYWSSEHPSVNKNNICSLLKITELPRFKIPTGISLDKAKCWIDCIGEEELSSLAKTGTCLQIKEFAMNLLAEKSICSLFLENFIPPNVKLSFSYLKLSMLSHDFGNSLKSEMKRFIGHVQEKNIKDISNEDSFKKFIKRFELAKEFFYEEAANNLTWYEQLEHLLFLRQSKIKILSNNALEYLSCNWPTELKENIHQESFQIKFLTRLESFGQILKQMQKGLHYEK